MKLKLVPVLVGRCGLFAAIAFSSISSLAASEAQTTQTTKNELPTSQGASSPALTRAEALAIVRGARQYVAHPSASTTSSGQVAPSPVIMPDFEMAAPPPPPRPETKSASPAGNNVWVAGHYMPVKGEWRWVRGEWAVPATPISVWIPAIYNAKTKMWNPGYWQPDAPTPVAAEVPATAAPQTSGSNR